jgi:hypothetical protein
LVIVERKIKISVESLEHGERVNLTHFQIANIANATMMRPVWFNVLTFLAKPHAIVDRTVEDGQVNRQMLQ